MMVLVGTPTVQSSNFSLGLIVNLHQFIPWMPSLISHMPWRTSSVVMGPCAHCAATMPRKRPLPSSRISLKMYLIKDSQSEDHYQHENPAKQFIQDVKYMTNAIMDHVGCSSHWWWLCMLYVILFSLGKSLMFPHIWTIIFHRRSLLKTP